MGTGGIGSGGQLGSGGTLGTGGSGGEGTGGAAGGDAETGRLVGITAAHNAVRASVQTSPPLSPVTWNPTIAAYAQQWADELATTSCGSPHHRSSSDLRQVGYGENLAAFSSTGAGSTAQEAVDGWSSEVSCYTLGTVAGTEQCDVGCYTRLNSDGCGHYTQIVWRGTTEIGCGVASCKQGAFTTDIWICNYKPPGNIVGQTPY
jgi:pathogenesis-related protein 1